MKNTNSNFVYLKATSIEKYYRDLVKAENVCEKLPDATKFIVRKVLDDLLKCIVEKKFTNSRVNFNELIDKAEKILPENIYFYVRIIKVNTDNKDAINVDKKLIRNHVQLLGLIHIILVWYLKNITNEISKNKVISFKTPNTIDTEKEVLLDGKNEIDNINYKIDLLRSQIISGENDVNKINNIREEIQELKFNKKYLDPAYNDLKIRIKDHEEDLAYVNEDYERAKKKIEELDKNMWEAYESLVNKERMLIKVEQENRELAVLTRQLEKKSDETEWNQKYSVFDLGSIREIYKKVSTLTNEYEKNLQKIKFSYDKIQEKALEKERAAIRTELNFQDKIFNEKIELYMKNVVEIKNRTKILKEIFYDTTLNSSIHREFARSFFNLEGIQLRVFYTMISKVNNISVFINKSKEILSKSSDDAFVNYIKENARELDKYSDEEVKLKLYYKLMKLSKLPYRDFEDRFEFIKTLDEIVEKAYSILKQKKDFKVESSKLDSIRLYYLNNMVKNKNNGEIITEKNLIGFIYNWRFAFNHDKEEELIPLFVMQCLITDKSSYDREYNMENHEKLIALWRNIQDKYNSIFSNKSKAEQQLITLLKEKKEMEKKCRSFTRAKSELGGSYSKYDLEFRNFVLNSKKIEKLPSYAKYKEALRRRMNSDTLINERKNKLGALKSVLSPDMWKSHSENIAINSNVSNIEKQLIEEAKKAACFQEEYKNLYEHSGKVEDISYLLQNQKNELKHQNILIEKCKNKIKEFQKQLRVIKEEYPDMKNTMQ